MVRGLGVVHVAVQAIRLKAPVLQRVRPPPRRIRLAQRNAWIGSVVVTCGCHVWEPVLPQLRRNSVRARLDVGEVLVVVWPHEEVTAHVVAVVRVLV
jgi:hypothetical protein